MDEELYCTECHGRQLDQNDHTCHHCNGTGFEPLDIPDTDE